MRLDLFLGQIPWSDSSNFPVGTLGYKIKNMSVGGGAAWGSITGTLSSQTDLQTALNGKSATSHNHDGVYQAAGSYAAASHSHAIADTTGLQAALDAKAPTASPTFTGTVSGVTKAMVGLGNVDNTADSAKPVSTAQQTALDLKANLASPTFTGTVSGITKAMVGLGNVDNTSDANKPISTATQTALDGKANTSHTQAASTISDSTVAGRAMLTAADAAAQTALLNAFTSALKGLVPASGGGTANFLRADGTWAAPGGGSDPWTYVKLASDFPTTSATAVDVTGLAFTPAANTSYVVEGQFLCRTATATVGPRPGCAWPTGLTDGVARISITSAAGTEVLQNGNSSAAVLAPVGGLPNTTQSYPANIQATIIAGASPAGTFKIQLASETAGTSVTMKAGSWIRYRAI